ncbi:MAG: fatty acid desaturase [Pseudomonadota bacterium]
MRIAIRAVRTTPETSLIFTDEKTATAVEWPTLIICAICYMGFAIATIYAQALGPVITLAILTLTLTLFSSFNHEVLHGHPFRNELANTVLVFPALGLLIPYPRFRDTHLAHHHDPSLTDPYDDPETNFIDPAVWLTWSAPRKWLYYWNNTLLGRMVIGPVIGLATFYAQDFRAVLAGDREVARAYVFHGVALVPVVWWLSTFGALPLWVYFLAVYLSHSILKIRTFLEHCAHEKARCRSVIIEDRGPLSFLFLKNNLHALHHARPKLPWYQLDACYAASRDRILTRNGGYAYRSYAQVARLFLTRAKDPVPHVLWDVPQDAPEETAQPQHPETAVS